MYGRPFRFQCPSITECNGAKELKQLDEKVVVRSEKPITDSDEILAKRLTKMFPEATVTPIEWPGIPDERASFGVDYDEIPQ